jgi:hypothetical protein
MQIQTDKKKEAKRKIKRLITILAIGGILIFGCVAGCIVFSVLTPDATPIPETPTATATHIPTPTPTATSTLTLIPQPSSTTTPVPPTAPPVVQPTAGPSQWMCPNSTEGAAYVGSVQSDPLKFHKVSCHHAARINAANRICFANRQVALDLGYVPCKTCKP